MANNNTILSCQLRTPGKAIWRSSPERVEELKRQHPQVFCTVCQRWQWLNHAKFCQQAEYSGQIPRRARKRYRGKRHPVLV